MDLYVTLGERQEGDQRDALPAPLAQPGHTTWKEVRDADPLWKSS